SPVARQAHNLKAAGSNPAPATKIYNHKDQLSRFEAAIGCRVRQPLRPCSRLLPLMAVVS
ncbi:MULTISPECIES: hypothetical protein, partial [unclassified Rhizobium]|uniref:hypothetical protein n=1 Tax=unclassified Rhizobium TaxID=2613769 RepID=UPI001AED3A3D